ncbi:transposase [Lipingzhangella halophila]|uniref:Transposase n=1 Tax=Lipingzhangella halophila TaxID=1783352 RepID=A0A7W7RNT0_9ACTN|nr:ISL3 family transposase [Lipingzhangella halophila]MBB4935137.1 transposase [Lipingzhangella halophila]
MPFSSLTALLFPHLAELDVEEVACNGATLRIRACPRTVEADCPVCQTVSRRVHSRYLRRMADAPVSGRETLLLLETRRFFCEYDGCHKRTFAEQIPGLTTPYACTTPLLRRMHRDLALALGGRPGSSLARRQAVGTGKDTLLRLIRALPDPAPGPVRALGVDDFALRKGHNYGTILIDMGTHRPIDLLPERSAESFAAWLREHPGIEVICRDRAGTYADGAARGAPTAEQVADRWHLLHNLGQAVERLVARLRSAWAPNDLAVPPPPEPHPQGKRVEQTRQRHAAVHTLLNTGLGIDATADRLQMHRKTVRKYARAADADELVVTGPMARQSSLDGHTAYLAARFAEGCTSAQRLHTEVLQRGARVSERTVRRFVHRLRAETAPAAPPRVPKVREVASMLLTHPDARSEEDRMLLKELCERCPELERARGLVARFCVMVVERTGAPQLAEWMSDAQDSGLGELRGFARGLGKDWNAVMAGLTLGWSSGAVEGTVTKLKALMRQMFGRAKPDLLRKRLLHLA